MRILQLIDSLEAGGAERMAVNYANLLSANGYKSYLCTTREEGLLQQAIDPKVEYLFLKRKKTLDLKAFVKLRRFVIAEDISVIHAHGSSFFLATLVKVTTKGIGLVWHDHYGNSESLKERPYRMLSFCSKYFDAIIAVNKTLETWAKDKLHCNHVVYLQNFYNPKAKATTTGIVSLKGQPGKRIVCLANLRPQKNHELLLRIFSNIKTSQKDWTLHLVGKAVDADYTSEIKNYIKVNNLSDTVFLYGSLSEIPKVLNQADIGMLTSKSEGLPLALIEYGMAKLPVICTDVGQSLDVIGENGYVIALQDELQLKTTLEKLIEDISLRNEKGAALYSHVSKNFSAKRILPKIIKIYNELGY